MQKAEQAWTSTDVHSKLTSLSWSYKLNELIILRAEAPLDLPPQNIKKKEIFAKTKKTNFTPNDNLMTYYHGNTRGTLEVTILIFFKSKNNPKTYQKILLHSLGYILFSAWSPYLSRHFLYRVTSFSIPSQ